MAIYDPNNEDIIDEAEEIPVTALAGRARIFTSRPEEGPVDLGAIRGPETFDDIPAHHKTGHDVATFHLTQIMDEMPIEAIELAKRFKELAAQSGIEFDKGYASSWKFLQPLNDRELTEILERRQKEFWEGYRAYRHIASDMLYRVSKEDCGTWKEEFRGARAAKEFVTEARRLGKQHFLPQEHLLMPWELVYEQMTGYEYPNRGMSKKLER